MATTDTSEHKHVLTEEDQRDLALLDRMEAKASPEDKRVHWYVRMKREQILSGYDFWTDEVLQDHMDRLRQRGEH